jgi:hypothetical protein
MKKGEAASTEAIEDLHSIDRALRWLKSGITRVSFHETSMRHIQNTPLKADDTLDFIRIDRAGTVSAIRYVLEQEMLLSKPELRDKPKKLEKALRQMEVPDFLTQTTLGEIALLITGVLLPACEEKLKDH